MKNKAGDDADTRSLDGISRRPSAVEHFLAIAGGIALFAALWAAIAHYRGGAQNGLVVWGLFFLFLLIYVPLTYVALRTAKLHGALRYVFCITAAPVYIALFIASTNGLYELFPALAGHFAQSMAAGGRYAGSTQAILSGLLSAAIFWFWYICLKRLDRAIYRTAVVGNTQTVQPGAPADEASPRR